MSLDSSPFPKSAFNHLASAEDRHWWFRARNEIIVWTLATKVRRIGRFLEVGCGTGYVLSGIANAFPSVPIEASEFFQEGLDVARLRVPNSVLRQLDATTMTESSQYSCIGSFDVLEHIEEDELVLANFQRALLSGGHLLLTVPQHPWLWSAADTYAHHVRRYTRQELLSKVKKAGFRVTYISSFVCLLLPLMGIQRLVKKNTSYNPDDELKVSSATGAFLYAIMKLEILLLKVGLRFPVGGSLLLLARKP